MKDEHDYDCSINERLVSGLPEAGICTCGYGLMMRRELKEDDMYSKELKEKLRNENELTQSDIEEIISEVFNGKK